MASATANHNNDPLKLLRPFGRPGLFITATSTDIGKTTVTAALAAALTELGVRVGVCKPISAGCPKHPDRGNAGTLADDDYLSPDGMRCALAANLDPRDESLMRHISPLRFGAPISPHAAARLENRQPDWRRVAAAFKHWQENCDALLVEGAGGWIVALDDSLFTIADLAAQIALPVLVVTGTYLGAMNHAALTVQAARQKGLAVAGLVVNRLPAERDLVVDTNLQELPRLCRVAIRATLPDIPSSSETSLSPDLIAALRPFAQEWWQASRPDGN